MLRSAGLAVVAAFAVRMLVLCILNTKLGVALLEFRTMGLETLMIGKNLATGHGFSGPMPRYDAVTAWLAPVYPAIVCLGYWLVRLDDFRAILFCQTLNSAFSAATCWPIYYLGRRIFSVRVGLVSAWVWVFLPVAILMPLEWIWDQSLSALIFALVLSATYSLRDNSSPARWSGYGLLWAFTALVNPTICVLLPFLAGWLIWSRPKLTAPSTLPALCARAALFFVLALVPWTARNWFEVGGLTFVKSNFGLELWLGNNPQVKEVFTAERHPAFDVRERIMLILSGEPNYMHAKQAQGTAFILSHPGTFLKLCWGRFVDNWAATYDSGVDPWISDLHIRKAYVWETTLVSLVAALGLLLALREDVAGALPLAFCMILFPIPYYITHTALRYRHPLDPVLALLIGYVLVRAFASRGAGPPHSQTAPGLES